jgi:hypothetical protein
MSTLDIQTSYLYLIFQFKGSRHQTYQKISVEIMRFHGGSPAERYKNGRVHKLFLDFLQGGSAVLDFLNRGGAVLVLARDKQLRR